MVKKSRWYRRLILALVFGLGLALVVVSYVPQPAWASGLAPKRATTRFEVRFMERMIDHHQMAIAMAQVCLDNVVHPELDSLCEQIIAAQSQEIEMMQTWLADWYGIYYESQMKPGDMQKIEKLASLKGAEFEIEFMQSMMKHHAKAIKEAEGCVEEAYHGELLGLCQGIIQSQRAEIQQMQTWLCEWYSICKENAS